MPGAAQEVEDESLLPYPWHPASHAPEPLRITTEGFPPPPEQMTKVAESIRGWGQGVVT